MARGWESKAIEAQMSEAEAKQASRARGALTQEERERQQRLQGLLLERARIERQLQESRDERYVALLQRALAHLETELAEFDDPPATS